VSAPAAHLATQVLHPLPPRHAAVMDEHFVRLLAVVVRLLQLRAAMRLKNPRILH